MSSSCCALPLPVQGLPECQQHLSGAFALKASLGSGAVSRLAPVGHLQQHPGGSVSVRKHLQMFPFWLQLVVRAQALWQRVKPGEAPASVTPAHTPFPPPSLGDFLGNVGNGASAATQGAAGCRCLPPFPAALQLSAGMR